jgi:multidrug efflux system outer membrane protein
MARRFRLATCAVCCVAMLGCKVGPDYERPPVAAPTAFRGVEAGNAAAQESIANVPWWELFKDSQLRDLIKVAL